VTHLRLVIEDSPNGILAAKAAGCIAAAIPTSFTKQELERSGADFVVDNFANPLTYIRHSSAKFH
jgi:beta-phosphoglucomutase-like phosphatase (HAD superfamily)